eukprot:m.5026 g.5026  ORF g.5026 m.5026 type:complete len:55 (-) comp3867_c0_seq1:132-296(-)
MFVMEIDSEEKKYTLQFEMPTATQQQTNYGQKGKWRRYGSSHLKKFDNKKKDLL